MQGGHGTGRAESSMSGKGRESCSAVEKSRRSDELLSLPVELWGKLIMECDGSIGVNSCTVGLGIFCEVDG